MKKDVATDDLLGAGKGEHERVLYPPSEIVDVLKYDSKTESIVLVKKVNLFAEINSKKKKEIKK